MNFSRGNRCPSGEAYKGVRYLLGPKGGAPLTPKISKPFQKCNEKVQFLGKFFQCLKIFKENFGVLKSCK